MNKRVTISLPEYVYEQLMVYTVPGEVSSFVTAAVSEKISQDLVTKNTDPWKAFLGARKLITKKNKISIKAAIAKGRM
ncbi:hypothetical protein HY085_02205 [Candidatus Gottesmanbacteria bacterium]|nr:hypothetical protein [Candidatus Gottesmanbacteria bacterium]